MITSWFYDIIPVFHHLSTYRCSQSDSLLMIRAAERTAADLRSHIAALNARLLHYEQLEEINDMKVQELHESKRVIVVYKSSLRYCLHDLPTAVICYHLPSALLIV